MANLYEKIQEMYRYFPEVVLLIFPYMLPYASTVLALLKVVRGEKAIKPNVIMPIVDCSCKNDLNNSEECGFAISLLTKKT